MAKASQNARARETNQQLFERLKRGYSEAELASIPVNKIPRYKLDTQSLAPLSNNMHVKAGFKKSVDDYKWRRDLTESPETVKMIEDKKGRIAPLYSKGAYQYVTPETDIQTLGKKV